jgi:hypothetical protein
MKDGGMRMKRLIILGILALAGLSAAETPWQEMPATAWKGLVKADVPALKRAMSAVLAHPLKEAAPLECATAAAVPAGLYEVRLTLRPSHIAGHIAFTSGVRVRAGGSDVADFTGAFFARVHEPEFRRFTLAQSREGPLAFTLAGYADGAAVEAARTAAFLKKGGPKVGGALEGEDKDDEEAGLDLGLAPALTPESAVYYLVDKVEFRPLTLSGHVRKVELDKIRYKPGETLKGTALLADLGGKGGAGALEVSLENGTRTRTKVKSLPVTLGTTARAVPFEIALPADELGYALVAEYVSENGADRSGSAEYFSIASNFQRVAIFGGGLSTRDVVLDEETIRSGLAKARADYFNATEYFAWAEDDLVEMSPDTLFWTSGQTNYRLHKPTLQRQIRLAHEQGVAVATYGKYVMSGLKGWETAYDYPLDHRSQYAYPVGMWNDVNVIHFDRRRGGSFRVYSKEPNVKGNRFDTWWSSFLPVGPDATPRMVRMAAEECVRSIALFGWDAIRWDGHPRGGGQCGRSGKYEAAAARQTQALVRYFKEIVAETYPDFRHGYNYLLIEPDKKHDWAVEDFELDELCRGGGLLMNESIGNASGRWTFDSVARNLQVEGDLCRERGGYYLGISFAESPRDVIIESALWAAAGCRPYNAAMSREIRRYCTRYSCYTFDENLRRLAAPEKVLAPAAPTPLWWQPFVYETPLVNGRRQLVVNLLNIPRDAKRPERDAKDAKPEWEMPPGCGPTEFALTLPAGLRASGAVRIDPSTLEVTALPLEGNRFTAPPVAVWSVIVVDLEADPAAPSLASLYGPPKTFGVPRAGVPETDRPAEVVLDPSVAVWEVNKRISGLDPKWKQDGEAGQLALEALSGEARDKALLARRRAPEELIKDWWKGGSLPADLALRDKAFEFGRLAPRRDGRFDVYYARGALDYRLRMPEAFAGLGRFRVHHAELWGAVRQGPGMGLANGIRGNRYPDFDALLFTGVPHAAIGAENSYALVEYVKAGGGVFFTGGEYAFGKGGYMHTVLERELLPFTCAGMQDTVTASEPRPFEPGPDFAELKTALDFSARPSYWVRNQAVLRPEAKVFLKSGDRPILVGWQLGQGRVACLLVDHRGRSDGDVTAFFDWKDWPRLAAAVLAWVAPEAGRSDPPAAAAGDGAAAAAELRKSSLQNETEDLLAGGGKDDQMAGFGETSARGQELKGEDLTKRRALIERVLAADGPETAEALAGQLAAVNNLPVDLRLAIVDRVKRDRPAAAAALGRKALASEDSAIRGAGYLLLAVAGDPDFAGDLKAPRSITGELDADALERQRDLALAVALYPGPDMVAQGRRLVDAWNRKEQATRAEFARICGDDTAMLETAPCLDAEALFQRAAWLAYLSRYDAPTYAAAFARQWVMLLEYRDYCGRSIDNLFSDKQLSGAVASARAVGWKSLAVRLGFLQNLTRPDMEAALEKAGPEAASGLAEARFVPELQSCVNLLGNLEPARSQAVLIRLAAGSHPDLAAFAKARLASLPVPPSKEK